MSIEIRPAQPSDAPQILAFITELADYEKARHEVIASVADIERSLFSEGATAHGLICLRDGVPIGFAVFFFSYSTWLGSNCLYLEDLYITPDQRGGGAGKTLLRHLAKVACDNDCGRFEWSVLDWNTPAIEFYNPSARNHRKSGCATEWTARCYGILLTATEHFMSARRTRTRQTPGAAQGVCSRRPPQDSPGVPWAPGASGAPTSR